jgi:hypothetical protein
MEKATLKEVANIQAGEKKKELIVFKGFMDFLITK